MGDGPPHMFRPDGERLLSFHSGGTDLHEDTHACLDCGLVWTWTHPVELQEFIKKHCD